MIGTQSLASRLLVALFESFSDPRFLQSAPISAVQAFLDRYPVDEEIWGRQY